MSLLTKINNLINRRSKRRVDLTHAQYPLVFEYQQQSHPGYLVNITQEGARICLENDVSQSLSQGLQGEVRFRLVNSNNNFTVPVELVWLSYQEDNENTQLGCRFLQVDTTQTRKLSDIAEYCARFR